ncbi:MAG: 3'(2'),5'-bisphosphate nucleotidase CysQ [Bacteroidota bacterium]
MNDAKIVKLVDKAIYAAISAGKKIVEIYLYDNFEIQLKSDNSPLTLADKSANEIINRILNQTGIPILSEENKIIEHSIRKTWELYWLVDPLDGTKEFIKRNGEFTVNIALIENNRTIAGIVFVPVTEVLYAGILNHGAFKICLQENKDDLSFSNLITEGEKLIGKTNYTEFTVVSSRSHMNEETEKFIENLKKEHSTIKFISVGSSLKICMVAEGKADIYPRLGPTMEWDTAAAHAVALASGCIITQSDGQSELVYNKEDLINPWFVVKSGK